MNYPKAFNLILLFLFAFLISINYPINHLQGILNVKFLSASIGVYLIVIYLPAFFSGILVLVFLTF